MNITDIAVRKSVFNKIMTFLRIVTVIAVIEKRLLMQGKTRLKQDFCLNYLDF